MGKLVCRIAGVFLLLCGVAPLLYGIFNAGAAALCAMGIFFAFLPHLWTRFAGHRFLRLIVGLGIGFLLLYCAVASALMAHKAWFDRPRDLERPTVIVPGAKVNGGTPSLMLRRRLDKALTYLEECPGAICIVTGGQGADEEYPEAQIMAAYLEDRGIDSDRILVEDASTSTRDNFRFGAALLRELWPDRAGEPVVVVTDSFHQLRASLFAKAAFPDVAGFDAISSLTPWGLMPMYWVREMFGVPVAVLQNAL